MSDSLTIIPQPIGIPRQQGPQRSQQITTEKGSFDQLLQKQLSQQGTVKFSRHASQRMQTRGITFSDAQLQRLDTAISQVSAKGGRESLVMLDSTALVVSVKNETVVTVVGQDQLKDNVFTNIDSAIIA
jgi:flagellar operon protein